MASPDGSEHSRTELVWAGNVRDAQGRVLEVEGWRALAVRGAAGPWTVGIVQPVAGAHPIFAPEPADLPERLRTLENQVDELHKQIARIVAGLHRVAA